jgi:hypothetical protein
LAAGLSGCAALYTDENGAQHVIGLVDMVVRPSENVSIAGNVVDVTVLGLSYLRFEDRAGFGLGYQRITSAAFRDNALAVGPFDGLVPTVSGPPRTLDQQ